MNFQCIYVILLLIVVGILLSTPACLASPPISTMKCARIGIRTVGGLSMSLVLGILKLNGVAKRTRLGSMALLSCLSLAPTPPRGGAGSAMSLGVAGMLKLREFDLRKSSFGMLAARQGSLLSVVRTKDIDQSIHLSLVI